MPSSEDRPATRDEAQEAFAAWLRERGITTLLYTGFATNTTNLRVEVNALFHVRNVQGAYRIAAT